LQLVARKVKKHGSLTRSGRNLRNGWLPDSRRSPSVSLERQKETKNARTVVYLPSIGVFWRKLEWARAILRENIASLSVRGTSVQGKTHSAPLLERSLVLPPSYANTNG